MYWPMHVGLKGLKARPELNGCCCLALRVDLKTGRLAVRLADRTHISVKSANVDLEPTKLLNKLKQAVTAEASGEHVEMGPILEQLRERGWRYSPTTAPHNPNTTGDNQGSNQIVHTGFELRPPFCPLARSRGGTLDRIANARS